MTACKLEMHFIAIVVITITVGHSAHACTCLQRNTSEHYCDSSFVGIIQGKVVRNCQCYTCSFTVLDGPFECDLMWPCGHCYDVDTIELLQPGRPEVREIVTAATSAACGVHFELGMRTVCHLMQSQSFAATGREYLVAGTPNDRRTRPLMRQSMDQSICDWPLSWSDMSQERRVYYRRLIANLDCTVF